LQRLGVIDIVLILIYSLYRKKAFIFSYHAVCNNLSPLPVFA
jgi:hypothetical protein